MLIKPFLERGGPVLLQLIEADIDESYSYVAFIIRKALKAVVHCSRFARAGGAYMFQLGIGV